MSTQYSSHPLSATGATLVLIAIFSAPGFASVDVPQAVARSQAVGDFHLCEADLNGHAETFACREHRAGRNTYLLLFKGGPSPKAVYARDAEGTVSLWRKPESDDTFVYDPPRPAGVPNLAAYRGTGVCIDGRDRLVPCSVFEHAAARDPHQMRYMVFYHPDGSGSAAVDAQVAGENGDALLAELAFQLGLALVDAGCCRAQAAAYLEYAHNLFPDAPVYGAVYRAVLDDAPMDTIAHAHVADRQTPVTRVGQ